MISAGVEGRLPYMTYPEPWRGPPKQPPELFLRPAPKPLPTSRYNGMNTSTPNGTRLIPPLQQPSRPISKFPSPPAAIPASPVNLVQAKDEPNEDLLQYSPYAGMFSQYSHFTYPYQQSPFIMSRNFPMPPTPLSPMEYPATMTAASNTSTYLQPSTFSPPSTVKVSQSILRDKRTPPQTPTTPTQSQPQVSFKVPSGKEGSLKHRILIRPEDIRNSPLDLQKPPEGRKRLQATMSPPRSPKKPLNNNTIPGNFAKGSLIQLANGELRRIEDMRTEDFVTSAENNPELRLAESTVVKIQTHPVTGIATITLTYNQRQAQVEVESSGEHPYFVVGHGWASCNPERSEKCYGLKVHKLQVGDILITLTPRETVIPSSSRVGSTIMTTATTTAMTSRQISSVVKMDQSNAISQPTNLQGYIQSTSPDRKRRWSAPDEICDELEQKIQRAD